MPERMPIPEQPRFTQYVESEETGHELLLFPYEKELLTEIMQSCKEMCKNEETRAQLLDDLLWMFTTPDHPIYNTLSERERKITQAFYIRDKNVVNEDDVQISFTKKSSDVGKKYGYESSGAIRNIMKGKIIPKLLDSAQHHAKILDDADVPSEVKNLTPEEQVEHFLREILSHLTLQENASPRLQAFKKDVRRLGMQHPLFNWLSWWERGNVRFAYFHFQPTWINMKVDEDTREKMRNLISEYIQEKSLMSRQQAYTQLTISPSRLDKLIENLRADHIDEPDIINTKKGTQTITQLSHFAVQEITRRLKEETPGAPEGWKTGNALCAELSINYETWHALIEKHPPSRLGPNDGGFCEEKEYRATNGSICTFYEPLYIERLKQRLPAFQKERQTRTIHQDEKTGQFIKKP